MGSVKLEKIKFSMERRVKNTRRVDIYLMVFAAVFLITFLVTQIMLGMYEV